MKMRFGGPLPIRVEMNGLMGAGAIVGLVGVAAWCLGAAGLFDGASRPFAGGGALGRLTAADLCLGVALAGMALYFLGRVVQIGNMLRRRK